LDTPSYYSPAETKENPNSLSQGSW